MPTSCSSRRIWASDRCRSSSIRCRSSSMCCIEGARASQGIPRLLGRGERARGVDEWVLGWPVGARTEGRRGKWTGRKSARGESASSNKRRSSPSRQRNRTTPIQSPLDPHSPPLCTQSPRIPSVLTPSYLSAAALPEASRHPPAAAVPPSPPPAERHRGMSLSACRRPPRAGGGGGGGARPPPPPPPPPSIHARTHARTSFWPAMDERTRGVPRIRTTGPQPVFDTRTHARTHFVLARNG
jgi:hypothetical protein